MVGETGFEPATLCSQSRCATRLRYSPRFVECRIECALLPNNDPMLDSGVTGMYVLQIAEVPASAMHGTAGNERPAKTDTGGCRLRADTPRGDVLPGKRQCRRLIAAFRCVRPIARQYRQHL